jgi:Fic family protein
MNEQRKIWQPIRFDTRWNEVETARFDNIRPSWDKKRSELSKDPEQYKQFIDQLKRKQAIDTGIIERLYDLKRGVTETLIKEGFVDSYLQHGDSNIDNNLLMDYLKDNFEAVDFVFPFVKDSRELSVFYIRSLHKLITRHQDTIEAVNPFGKKGPTPLLKGEFKKLPNYPTRDGIIYEYCPPELVGSEMDNLIKIFYSELNNVHALIKAAVIHHLFVQIHPFQDGNGRIARLLASFVLMKDNLFPFSLDRDERAAYIDALEAADSGKYQKLVDIIADNQIKSIEQALNLGTVKSTGYDSVLTLLNKKIAAKTEEALEQQKDITKNMDAVFDILKERGEYLENDLRSKLCSVELRVDFCSPDGADEHYYSFQIAQYAKEHNYYFNTSLPRRWVRLRMYFDDVHHYQLILSLHHYGYDNSTFAVGAFIEKEEIKASQAQRNETYTTADANPVDDEPDFQTQRNEIYVAVGVPPLVFASAIGFSTPLQGSIRQQIDAIITATLGYIAEELT